MTSWLPNIVRGRVPLQYMLESTVVQRETDRAASLLFLPNDALGLLGLDPSPNAIPGLGVVRGVQIPSPEGLEDVFFASMSGRYVPFDEGSFERWRPQRESRSTSYEAAFAHQLATSELVAVTSSPIRGTSLVNLMTQGTAWTVSVAEGLAHDPLRGLAVLVVSEIGITIAQVVGAARSTAVIAVKWRMRQRLGIPADWVPPEDRPPKP
jgi:hypothetical protein